MINYVIYIQNGDAENKTQIVDKAAFDAAVAEAVQRGYEVCKGEPEIESIGTYYTYYAVKDGKRCFEIGFERVT